MTHFDNDYKTVQETSFQKRHIGPSDKDVSDMLDVFEEEFENFRELPDYFARFEEFIEDIIPAQIVRGDYMPAIPEPVSEHVLLDEMKELANQNEVKISMIGQGYYSTHTPSVILRNVIENPAWYTAYTPYQPEISQGRLEALLNFQTMVSSLTGMELANSSLLDEGTAAVEAMLLCYRQTKSDGKSFFVDEKCHPQTIDLIKARAKPLNISVIVQPRQELKPEMVFGALFQYPDTYGHIQDYTALIDGLHQHDALAVMATDLLALTVLKTPASMGADVVIGSAQRFGVPMGFGGPHAGFFATKDVYKRHIPGRLVGVSVDADGKTAYRLALQTREQHIRREKATSNICTAQALLANVAGFYAVYHGAEGLKQIASRVNRLACLFLAGLGELGYKISSELFFDTVTVVTGSKTDDIFQKTQQAGINIRRLDNDHLSVAFDELSTPQILEKLWVCFGGIFKIASLEEQTASSIPKDLIRQDTFLDHPVFHSYHNETAMMRYLRRLADYDLALDRTMIPLGSCTMKLNAATEMMPITWPEFAHIHPFAPFSQTKGYLEIISRLETYLAEITGFDAVSLQPNSGAQGEYAGLMAISGYHQLRGEEHRNICLVPASAHGTNPASAVLAGMKVVVVACDESGNIDVADLKKKVLEYASDLSALMVTYPSTHGVFETAIRDICQIVHDAGGQVYMDGANMNAQVGLTSPALIGADVCHLNLHKTFCIPHGGGGPGVGPIAVKAHLSPFLCGHQVLRNAPMTHRRVYLPVSSAPFGSASILPICYAYIRMMGAKGLKRATEVAILNANYIAKRLSSYYPILYKGEKGYVAHECILDIRPIKDKTGVSVDDIAKRLMDFGFHAPTMSFPVAGTLMVEPTESEDLTELNRFCDAMIAIWHEIQEIETEKISLQDSPLTNAPHTAEMVLSDDWNKPYSRTQAAFPDSRLKKNKYWPPVRRIDHVYGDRNVICTCPPVTEFVT